jgi:hypothetical protein
VKTFIVSRLAAWAIFAACAWHWWAPTLTVVVCLLILRADLQDLRDRLARDAAQILSEMRRR